MANDPLVSVILPVYNGERTIGSTLRSLLDQSFTNFEMIVCIDGSADQSEDIVNSFGDRRIRVYRNVMNMGLGRTLNRLISLADPASKYIALAEQDDYYYPERLKLQVEHLERRPDCVLVSGLAEHYDGAKVSSVFPGILARGESYPVDKEQNYLLNYCYQIKVVNSCMMVRKSFHLDNGLYFSMHYPSISVDWSYILRVSLLGRIDGLSVPLVRLDRAAGRNSLTTKKDLQHRAARELIRSFYYENAGIISRESYKTALTTQYLLELGGKSILHVLVLFPIYFLKNPSDMRWVEFLRTRIMKSTMVSTSMNYLKLAVSKAKLKRYFSAASIDAIIEATRNYEGHGVFSRISMSQKVNEIKALAEEVKKLKPMVIVEIGTRKGGTLFVWCRYTSARKVVSIDLPGGIHGGGYPEEKQRLYQYFLSDQPNRTLHLLQQDSHDVATLARLESILGADPIDFLFIDGDHTYNGVKSDFDLYSKFVRKGGVIAFHDIVDNKTDHEDAATIEVPRFWREIKEKYIHKEFIQENNRANMGIGMLWV